MIKVTQEREAIYTAKLDVPDMIVVNEIGLGMGMTKTSVLASCINKGISYYADMLREIAAHETRKRK